MFTKHKTRMNFSSRDPNHQNDGFWFLVPFLKKMSDRNSIVFGTDTDRNRVTRETPRSEAIPHRRKPLGLHASHATQRKRRYEANKCGWTQPLFRKARDRGIN